MPYLVPISICGILHLFVLILFVFWAEETLSKKELDSNRAKKATIDVIFEKYEIMNRKN